MVWDNSSQNPNLRHSVADDPNGTYNAGLFGDTALPPAPHAPRSLDTIDELAQRVTKNLRRPNSNVVVGMGASIVTWLTLDSSYMPACYDNLVGHLCLASKQRMRYGGVIGHGGHTQAQMISTYLPTVLAMDPAPGACVYYDAPYNDIATGVSFAQTKANLHTVLNALESRGILAILGTVPGAYYGGVGKVGFAKWNKYIRRFASDNGYPLIDHQSVMVDINGDIVTGGLNSDEVHPTSKGNKAVATEAISRGLANIFPVNGNVLTSKWIGDTANLLNDGTNNIGLFNADTDADGVSDGWLLNGGSVAKMSRVTPGGGDGVVGKWQRFSHVMGDAQLWLLKILTPTVGHKLAISARVRTTGIETTQSAWTVGLVQYFSGGYNYPAPGVGSAFPVGSVQAGCVGWLTDVTDDLMYTTTTVLPATTSIYATVQLGGAVAAGTAVLDVAEFTITDLTTGEQFDA